MRQRFLSSNAASKFLFLGALVCGAFLFIHISPAKAEQYNYPDYFTIQPVLATNNTSPHSFNDLTFTGTSNSSPNNMVLFAFDASTGAEISNSGWDPSGNAFGNSVLAMISNCGEGSTCNAHNGGGNIYGGTFGSLTDPIELLFGDNNGDWGNCAESSETLSDCVSAMEADNDAFSMVELTVNTIHLSSSSQYEADGTTVIPESGTTTGSTVVTKGVPSSPSGGELQLQVELRASGIPFSGIPTATSSAVSTTIVASATLPDLANGFYHWQSRAMDLDTLATSTWQPFDGNACSDFIVGSVPVSTYNYPTYFIVTPSSSSTNAAPYIFNDLTFSSCGPNDLTLKDMALFVFDADSRTQLSNSGWRLTNDNATSTYGNTVLSMISEGSEGMSTTGQNGGNLFTTSTFGSMTDPIVMIMTDNNSPGFGTCPSDDLSQCISSREGQYDFSMVEIYPPTTPSLSSLGQYMSDATSSIGEGSTTLDSTVVFGANLWGAGTTTIQLQVEVKPVGVAFSNIANVTSSFISSHSEATATITGLANESYHWQARAFDGTNYSNWQAFGGGADTTDFTVAVAMSMHFDGSSALAYPASNVEFTATDPWTIEFWYRTPEPTSSDVDFINMISSGTDEGYFVRRDADNGIQFGLECDSGFIGFRFAADSSTFNGTSYYDTHGIWHQVAITKTTSTSESDMEGYFDGVQQITYSDGDGPVSGNCFSSTSTNSIWLGGEPILDTLDGDMDEVRVWNIAESSSSIASDWNQQATSTSDLRGLWQFNSTSAELVMENSPDQVYGAPSFSTSSPFGHFLLNQAVYPTSASSDQLLWYASSTDYAGYLSSAEETWMVEGGGGITIASTTFLSNANVVVSDINSSSSDYGFDAEWSPATPLNSSTLIFNKFYLDTYDPEEIENATTHELGHALGLDHSFLGNVMNSYNTDQINLGNQDIRDFDYLKGQGIWGN